jgi:hypothetical protein
MADDQTAATTAAATQSTGENNISPEEASRTLVTGAAMLQRAWLQAADNIGKAISEQKPVSHGAFDDLKRIREQFEELDRANTAITRISQAQAQAEADR